MFLMVLGEIGLLFKKEERKHCCCHIDEEGLGKNVMVLWWPKTFFWKTLWFIGLHNALLQTLCIMSDRKSFDIDELIETNILKLVPSAIHIHPYLYWLFIELMDKWHWTSPRQIKVEKTVIYSFSLFETGQQVVHNSSVSECLYVCLLCSVFMCFCVSSFHVWGDCVSPLSMSQRAEPGPIYKVSWPEGSRLSVIESNNRLDRLTLKIIKRLQRRVQDYLHKRTCLEGPASMEGQEKERKCPQTKCPIGRR